MAITDKQIARLEKSLRGAAELGLALAQLSREILSTVKSAEAAILSLRQTQLPIDVDGPAKARDDRYEENTKRISRAIERGQSMAELAPPRKRKRRG